MLRSLRRLGYGVLFVLVIIVTVLSFQQVTYTNSPGCDRPTCGSGGDSECGSQCCCGVGGTSTPPCGRTNDGCVVK
jgi:hypothetical protein